MPPRPVASEALVGRVEHRAKVLELSLGFWVKGKLKTEIPANGCTEFRGPNSLVKREQHRNRRPLHLVAVQAKSFPSVSRICFSSIYTIYYIISYLTIERTKMRSNVDVVVRGAVEGLMTHLTRDGKRRFFETDSFPWAATLEAEWKTMRRELDAVLVNRDKIPNFQDISTKQKPLTSGQQWKLFVFYWYGLKAEENCARCPETARLMERIPGMKSAMFSILAPRKHIPPHRGMYKGVLRYHLGLIVPEPKGSCRIRVDQDIRPWEEGKGLMFDDTYEHEVWNDTDSYRTVLILDIVRPLFFPLSLVNRQVLFVASHMKSYTEPMDYVR